MGNEYYFLKLLIANVVDSRGYNHQLKYGSPSLSSMLRVTIFYCKHL